MKIKKIVVLLGLFTLLAGWFAGNVLVQSVTAKMGYAPVATVSAAAGHLVNATVAYFAPINARPITNPLLELLYFLFYFFFRPI